MTKRKQLVISEKTHKQLKVEAARAGKTIQQIAEEKLQVKYVQK